MERNYLLLGNVKILLTCLYTYISGVLDRHDLLQNLMFWASSCPNYHHTTLYLTFTKDCKLGHSGSVLFTITTLVLTTGSNKQ